MLTEDSTSLSTRDLEHFRFTVEAALQVRRTHQFFLWVQGPLHALIPHGVIFCVHGNLPHAFTVTKYTDASFPDSDLAELTGLKGGLIADIVAAWKRNGSEPLLVCPDQPASLFDKAFRPAIAHYHLDNVLCHGAPSVNGSTGTCFIFARMPPPRGPIRLRYLAQLLVPYLHAAFVRTLIETPRQRLPALSVRRLLTGREVEVLQFVSQGRSNLQIGRTLRISQHTVRNHVQNILKKLEVRNRAQAVSRAINLELIDSGHRV